MISKRKLTRVQKRYLNSIVKQQYLANAGVYDLCEIIVYLNEQLESIRARKGRKKRRKEIAYNRNDGDERGKPR